MTKKQFKKLTGYSHKRIEYFGSRNCVECLNHTMTQYLGEKGWLCERKFWMPRGNFEEIKMNEKFLETLSTPTKRKKHSKSFQIYW